MILPVEPVLRRHDLAYPALSVLQANHTLFTALLIQPTAKILVSQTAIGNYDQAEAHNIFSNALSLARNRNVDLLITPEYSVPWATLEHELSTNGGPGTGQLWVLGCESLSKAEVANLKNRFQLWAVVIHEDFDPDHVQPATGVYVNPLAYIFRTSSTNGTGERLAMVVQFKTEPSGDPENTEIQGMVKGNAIYLFEGPREEIRLVTFICSDVLALQQAELDRVYDETLIVHIQLNEKPRTTPYAAYRRRLFNAKTDRTELICLNWASGIKYHIDSNPVPIPKTNISCSSWISRSNEVSTDDARIESNQGSGLYYTRHDKEKLHMLHFSYQPGAFLLRATKVKHSGVPAGQSYRRGPELVDVYEWIGGSNQWQLRLSPLSDGFQTYCTDYPGITSSLQSLHLASPLSAERATLITCGEFGTGSSWFHIDSLLTAKICDDEVVHRITVTQDPDGSIERNERVSKLKALNDVAPHVPFQAPLDDLKAGFTFSWSHTHPVCNVKSTAAPAQEATVVFAGVGLGTTILRNLYAKTAHFARSGSQPDRFCVVYLDGVTTKVYEPLVSHPYTNEKPAGSADFTEPEK